MTKRVFISRDLRSDSPFLQLLSQEGFAVSGRSLVQFSAINFLHSPPADWVFCYSSRSADFFLQGLTRLGLPAHRYPQYAALGQGTARRLRELGITPAFTGSGEPEETATAFLERARGQRVLFPHAEQSRQSIQRLLSGRLEMLDLIVYRNEKIEDARIAPADYVVLTSPLNAEAFVESNPDGTWRFVAIGNTTAAALDRLGIRHYRIAERASEAAMAELVLHWEKSDK
ncbi:uroporphyrinogen-III synthase [Flavilitoribacter nigricans]|uniref:uroporphyrinogen-III synthase n=1 Tax=Flavilitoribacter nigricans TaxID=70997 RepID=UPI0014730AC5|nr:uroporphyrinogen-III synthase [Flavilitoribacter nigricans]